MISILYVSSSFKARPTTHYATRVFSTTARWRAALTPGLSEGWMHCRLMRVTMCARNSSRGQSNGEEQKPNTSPERGMGDRRYSKDSVRAWYMLGACMNTRT